MYNLFFSFQQRKKNKGHIFKIFSKLQKKYINYLYIFDFFFYNFVFHKKKKILNITISLLSGMKTSQKCQWKALVSVQIIA